MKTSDYDFDLPESLIAQHPLQKRSDSRLLVADCITHQYQDRHFYDIVEELDDQDVLVINNTRVIPARLFGVKEETNAHVELLILKSEDPHAVECLVGNAKVVKLGTRITFGEGELVAECCAVGENGLRTFEMMYDGLFLEVLERLGETPLPPYIREKLDDPERYQTVYAKHDGSAAAPTAGLHFTPALLEQLKAKGVAIIEVTLHVGLGTFRPVSVENPKEHVMHEEEYWMSEESAHALNRAKQTGKHIIAVGTTSIRVLESQLQMFDAFQAYHGVTSIFIYPGFEFKAVDGLITNFHLPKSTLMMLISAFAQREWILELYTHAIEEEYRFFSFGDSMFLKRYND